MPSFLDKVKEAGKNLGEKIGDTVETTKLNGKIGDAKKAIEDVYKKIGEAAYAAHKAGEKLDIAEHLASIDEHNALIDDLKAQIEKIKEEEAAKKEAAKPPVCPQCGETVEPDAKFCPKCGAKLGE
ncbi:MAG: zinc ribbon domain-containing protein [Erysipelotrichaceae bacterium]|jgi:tRNA(Ile2) C34 agmatinyltransferase TiaS|nr:zinc ribbon domain-containing protein [Erysipelotrichaceae bacterium]